MAKKPVKKSAPAKTKTAGGKRTLVTFVLDATQSMQSIKESTLEAFNSYVGELKNSVTPVDFTLVTFNRSEIKKVHFEVPVKDVPELTAADYRPQAMTPLIEAATKAIRALEAALPAKKGNPKVVFCIQTDGQENCSGSEYSWASLKTLIDEKKAAGWQFLFMGAGIDAYNQGAMMGIAQMDTVSYNHLDKGATRSAFRSSAVNTSIFAAGLADNASYTSGQKLAAGDSWDPDRKPPRIIGSPTPRQPFIPHAPAAPIDRLADLDLGGKNDIAKDDLTL